MKINKFDPKSPLMKLVEKQHNPKKEKLISLRDYQIHLLDRGWCSSYWKDFYPKWMKANGLPSDICLSKKAWDSINETVGAEFRSNHDQFLKLHDSLMKSGTI
jgi:hypothetical protein